MRVRARVDQLDVEMHLPAGPLNAPLEHTGYAEFRRDPFQIAPFRILVGHDGGAGNDSKIVNLGERRDHLVLQPFGEEFIVRVRAEVFERQHRNRLARATQRRQAQYFSRGPKAAPGARALSEFRIMNHLTEEQFVLYYYGEGDGSPRVRAHLDACEACRAEYASLQRVLNVVDSAPVPERDANYGAQVWNRLRPSLGGRRLRWGLPWGPAPHWAAAALVATLIVAAFLAGRYYTKAQPGAQTANAGQVRERILLVAVGDHLERSQTVLLELVNARPGQSLDVASERARPGDLA